MELSTLEEYSVRCALRLASHFGAEPLCASAVAEQEGLSVEYVSKIMHLFKKSGLVDSERGTQGGFFLKNAPSAISIKMVLDAIHLPTSKAAVRKDQSFCGQFTGLEKECVHLHTECRVKPVWNVLFETIHAFLGNIFLSDLLRPEPKLIEKARDRAIGLIGGNKGSESYEHKTQPTL